MLDNPMPVAGHLDHRANLVGNVGADAKSHGTTSLEPVRPGPVSNCRGTAAQAVTDRTVREAGHNERFEGFSRYCAFRQMPGTVYGAQAVLLQPVRDGRRVETDLSPDLHECE